MVFRDVAGAWRRGRWQFLAGGFFAWLGDFPGFGGHGDTRASRLGLRGTSRLTTQRLADVMVQEEQDLDRLAIAQQAIRQAAGLLDDLGGDVQQSLAERAELHANNFTLGGLQG